jgi:hypothetical protein
MTTILLEIMDSIIRVLPNQKWIVPLSTYAEARNFKREMLLYIMNVLNQACLAFKKKCSTLLHCCDLKHCFAFSASP